MQSSRRKRDRVETDDKKAIAATTSRGRGARGSPAQKKLHTSRDQEQARKVVEKGTETSQIRSIKGRGSMKDSSRQAVNNKNAKKSQSPPDPVEIETKPSVVAENENGNDHVIDEEKPISSPQHASADEEESNEPKMRRQSLMQENNSENTMLATSGASAQVDDERSREEGIIGLLVHRRMLLERIKQCRIASEGRLENLAEQKPPPGKDGKSTNLSADDNEVAAFAEMSRRAINAAKKQRSDTNTEGQQHGKRAPISLRRGSSVGKRMSMALSTLAPHAVVVPLSKNEQDITTSSHTQQIIGSQTEVSQRQQSGAATVGSLPAKEGVSVPAGNQATTYSVSQPSTNPPTYKSQAIAAASGLSTTTGGHVSKHATGGSSSGQKKRSRSTKSQNASSARVVATMSSSETQPPASQPLHVGAAGNTLPHNRLAQTNVVYPEAAMLRERRNAIQTQLDLLLREQKKGSSGVTDPSSSERTQSRSKVDSSNSSQKLAAHSFDSTVFARRDPARNGSLPRRRRTHWDYLLEEMRWLATDYIEERKWKASSARTLSSAVASSTRPAAPKDREQSDVGRSQRTVSKKGKIRDSKQQENGTTELYKSKGQPETEVDRPRRHEQPSAAELKCARVSAAIMSDMIAELFGVASDVGMLSKSDAAQTLSVKHHLEKKKRLLRSGKCEASKSSINASGQAGPSERVSSDASESSSDKEQDVQSEEGRRMNGMPCVDVGLEELSIEEITHRVEILKKEVKGEKSPRAPGRTKTSCPVALSATQSAVVHRVGKRWSKGIVGGAILTGSLCSGKTIAACASLWSFRKDGPQLVICPPASVIRWKLELSKFEGLDIITFGLGCGMDIADLVQTPTFSCDDGDVVVCEYAALEDLSGRLASRRKVGNDIKDFGTVVVDCRNSWDFTHHGVGQNTHNMSPELMSSPWWNKLLTCVCLSCSRRLLVERVNNEMEQQDQTSEVRKADHRNIVHFLAAKAAFVTGGRTFYSGGTTIIDKVVSWAKHQAKSADAKVSEDRLLQMKECLRTLVQSCSQSLEFPPQVTNEIWDRWTCKLPPPQRQAYDRCCADVRGALSAQATNRRGNTSYDRRVSAAAWSILRLRRACVHPSLQDTLLCRLQSHGSKLESCAPANRGIGSSTLAGSFSLGFDRRISGSSSQFDLDFAVEVLNSSAKLRELLYILRFECGYLFDLDDDFFEESGKSRVRNLEDPGRSAGKKVVVLACSPEIQLLTSQLFNALGLAHELLIKSPSSQASLTMSRERKIDCNVSEVADQTYSWIECQIALAKFEVSQRCSSFDEDRGDHGRGYRSAVDLIVTSPATVSPFSGGVRISSADFIISLDEDWSGRSQCLLASIVSCRTQANSLSAKDSNSKCRFIRLVCEETCEDNFLRGPVEKQKENDLGRQAWPVDVVGFFKLPMSSTQPRMSKQSKSSLLERLCLQEESFRFPCRSISAFFDAELDSVLCSKQTLPPTFLTGAKMKFLPTAGRQREVPAVSERIKSGNKTEGETTDTSLELNRSFILNVMHAEVVTSPLSTLHEESIGQPKSLKPTYRVVSVVPPLPSKFRQMVISRLDLPSLSSRMFVERFAKMLVWGDCGALSTSPGGALSMQPDTSFLVDSPDNAELANAWHKRGLSCKPEELSSSLLVYTLPDLERHCPSDVSAEFDDKKRVKNTLHMGSNDLQQSVNRDEENNLNDIGNLQQQSTRSNAYSHGYSKSGTGISSGTADGNLGIEPKVYFPPLFPNIVPASEQARNDMSAAKTDTTSFDGILRQDVMAIEALDTGGRSNKRKAPAESYSQGGKRPRLQHTSSWKKPHHVSPVTSTHFLPLSLSGMKSSNIARDSSSKDGKENSNSATLLNFLNEDYGLAGAGYMSSQYGSAQAAIQSTIEVSTYSSWKHEAAFSDVVHNHHSKPTASEFEEAGAVWGCHLDSVILFVAKQNVPSPWGPSTFAGRYLPTEMGVPAASPAWAASNVVSRGATSSASMASIVASGNGHVNGSGPAKKKKKGQGATSFSADASAFSRLPSLGYGSVGQGLNSLSPSAPLQSGNPRDVTRLKVLSALTGMQGNHHTTLFDYSSFQLAFVRVRNAVSERVTLASIAASLSSNFGSGIPVGLLKQRPNQSCRENGQHNGKWVSIVVGSSDADKSEALSALANKTSLATPYRVDFGPFQTGFLSSSSGMTSMPAPGTTVGISLPMGVKISQEQKKIEWHHTADEALKSSVLRFGQNFHLAAAAVSSIVVDSSFSFRVNDVTLRSERQCLERFNEITKDSPSVADEMQRSETSRCERASRDPESILSRVEEAQASNDYVASGEFDALVPRSYLSAFGKTTTIEASEGVLAGTGDQKAAPQGVDASPLVGPERWLKTALSKKLDIHVAIPGVIREDGAPSVVQSHPTHMESIQNAVSGATSAGGRSDMWPLQLLDLADKQRGTTIPSRKSSQLPRSGTSSSSSRHTASAASSSGAPGANTPAVGQPARAAQQQDSPYRQVQQGQHNDHQQRITPVMSSPSRSPHRTPSAMPRANSQQFLATQSPASSQPRAK